MRGGIARRPELKGELMLYLEPLRERTKVCEVHTMHGEVERSTPVDDQECYQLLRQRGWWITTQCRRQMMKRGLVLEGGGAKGANQFGCLLALAEHGIQVDAISGTSVSAPNGALVAYDRLAEGRIWSHLSPGKVVAPRYLMQRRP